ncbi:MAG: hypothetical protein AAB922_05240 [Patescibacteria group bacterium]
MNEISNTIKLGLISPQQRASFKANAIAKIGSIAKVKRTDYFGGFIEIISIKEIENGVEVLAKAWDSNNNPIGFGKDGTVEIERFVIINPPVLVDDPNGDIIRTWTDEKTGEIKQRKLREDLQEALLQSLSHTILVKKEKFGSENIIAGKIGNTTTTVYPAAGAVEPVDGLVGREGVASVSWATIRSGVGNAADDLTADQTFCRATSTTTTDEYQTLDRFVAGFNTSSIPDTDTISSAILSIYGTGKNDNMSLSVAVDHRNAPASTSALVASDFDIAAWDNVKQNSSDITITAFSITGYNNFTFNATGNGNINKTGLSWFGVRIAGDISNTAPTWVSAVVGSILGYHADQAGTANDPKLVVEHSAAVTFIPQIIII